MAFTFLREKTLGSQRKMQQYLIAAFIGVLLITTFILWKGFSKSSSSLNPQYVAPQALQAKKVEIDFGVLQDKIFDELEIPPTPPLVPKNSGRPNPFIPF